MSGKAVGWVDPSSVEEGASEPARVSAWETSRSVRPLDWRKVIFWAREDEATCFWGGQQKREKDKGGMGDRFHLVIFEKGDGRVEERLAGGIHRMWLLVCRCSRRDLNQMDATSRTLRVSQLDSSDLDDALVSMLADPLAQSLDHFGVSLFPLLLLLLLLDFPPYSHQTIFPSLPSTFGSNQSSTFLSA